MKSSLEIFGERIGKTPDEFTPTDWRKAAQTLACVIDTDHSDERGDTALPQRIAEAFTQAVTSKAKKRGRRKKVARNALAALFYESRRKPIRPRGRPRGSSVLSVDPDGFSELITYAMRPNVRAEFIDPPKSRKEMIRRILPELGIDTCYTDTIARRERETRKKRKKIGNK